MPPIVMGNLHLWMTPVWVLSVGVTVGAVALVLLYALVWLVARRAAASIPRVIQESILLPISYIVLIYVGICLLGSTMMPVGQMIDSLRRLPAVGEMEVVATIPPRSEDVEVAVDFRADELQRFSFASDQDLVIGVETGKALTDPLFEIEGGEAPYTWTSGGNSARQLGGWVTKFYVSNESDAPTDLTIQIRTDVEMSEVHDIPIIAASVVGLYVIYFAIFWLFPGLSAIALATAKEAVAQPIYLLVLLGGTLALVSYIYIPYNTLGEDVKILKDSGLTSIMVLAILIGVWTASVSVADEIEGRTALTVLSKPISRRQFILGKFVGIVWPVVLLFIVLGAILLVTVSYKVVYDARETTNPTPEWTQCYAQMIDTTPGLVLGLFEAVVLIAISVAISTRLPMLPNLVICGSIYALGHLGPLIVQSSAPGLEYVAFIGQLIALVLPVLDHFNIQAAVAGGAEVPSVYLAWALLYCVLYTAAVLLLALILFEDRDLA